LHRIDGKKEQIVFNSMRTTRKNNGAP